MKLSNYEKETIFNYSEADKTASVYTHNEALQRQLLALCESHPAQIRQTSGNAHEGQTFELPKKWVKVAPPRVLSEAQRQVLEKMNQKNGDGKDSSATPAPLSFESS